MMASQNMLQQGWYQRTELFVRELYLEQCQEDELRVKLGGLRAEGLG